ncbi:uncharacterized protein TRIADDRAFT_56983 [Trichoplax adhaerens]|uniref:Cholesterol side-chain cleavage enzyme, mitochondrial n=1 Tax=Trichoplax adhaerens TaxID=10228 RepID=B3RX39_TRIAD|nr:hypothetical protein TRIADDRAFT_56983 [Trichoplax adhaerens]EDV24804.1 hypothetical protein TRIADDRAFT_56983 [Trichoplax adhaerens]|eukprot:XP_002112694.1 hypothetical protein TRIADDRAFT_56983 [Trichoplax adhaerens]
MLIGFRKISLRSCLALRVIAVNGIVNQSTAVGNLDHKPNGNNESVEVKPFSEIPGPKGLPLIGSLLTVLKNDGYYIKKTHLYMIMNAKKYGRIHKDKMGNFDEGEEWRRFRSILDKKLLKVKDVSAYSGRMNDVITDLINYLTKKQLEDDLNGEISNLRDCLYKWSFETIGTILYNKRLGTLQDPPNPIAEKFYHSVCLMFEQSNDLAPIPPYYKYFKTKYWKDYCQLWDTMFEIAEQLINEEHQRLQQIMQDIADKSVDLRRSEELEFLPYVLLRGELNSDEIVGNIIDLMIAAVDTSANTMLWTLYILGKNPEIQEKLYQEVSNVLKKGEYPDSGAIQKMSYLRALIKETQRMYPILPGVPRFIDTDIVLAGYRIPANTRIMAGFCVMSCDESIFDEPTKFKPERWIRSPSKRRLDPYIYTAFSFGPRMCIGRRVAELQMQLLIARLISQFRVECRNTGEVGQIIRTVASPETDIRIALEPRIN